MAKKKLPYELELLDEWTKRLGLQDWSIVLETDCHPGDMKLEGSVGCTAWEESTKSAFIQIVDPDRVTGLTREFDFEQILVHELLHLKTCLLDTNSEDDTLSSRVLHQLIDDLARAMVDIKKKGKAEI